MKLVYFGSGEFGLPTLRRLIEQHDVSLVVSQPDRPAGRSRRMTATPIAELAAQRGLTIIKPQSLREPAAIDAIRTVTADALVVIAYGHKLPSELLGNIFAINLHASLLPKYHGAAPINWAMINGETQTGVSVIALASKMDAGDIFAQAATAIDPSETAGELHDRLAEMGPDLTGQTLSDFQNGRLQPRAQDHSQATRAPKLSKSDGTTCFDMPARMVQARIHGLTPWPGCTVRLNDRELRLLRATHDDTNHRDLPGTVLENFNIACGAGSIRLLEVQPPGGRMMTFLQYLNGHPMHQGPGAAGAIEVRARMTPL